MNITVCWIRTKDFQCAASKSLRTKGKRRSQIGSCDGNDGGPRRAAHTDTQLETWMRRRKKNSYTLCSRSTSPMRKGRNS